MLTVSRGKRIALVALGLVLLLSPFATPLAATAAAPARLVDGAFDRVWNHSDKPVQDRVVARTWMWGPTAFATIYEPYAEGHGGAHAVRYLPWTELVRAKGGNTYRLRGVNWPAGTRLTVVLWIAGKDEAVVGTATTDGNGMFQLVGVLPRLPENGKPSLELQAKDQRYRAWFAW